MNRLVLGMVGALALAATAGQAAAADLPRRPAPAPVPYAAPMYNWTGFYIGVSGGGAFGHSDWTSTGGFDLSGGLIGGTVGYNWQAVGSPWMLGLEADASWTNINGDTTTLCALGCKTENSWLATVRGRLGYAFDRIMPYATGGLALGNIEASTPGFSGADNTNAGWTVGAGLEVAIAGGWTAKAEYLYVDLGDINCGLNCGGGLTNDTVSFTSHLVRGGINYRF